MDHEALRALSAVQSKQREAEAGLARYREQLQRKFRVMGLYLAHVPRMVTGEPDAQTKETIWDPRFPKPPVEPIDEFVDVLLEPVRLHGTLVSSKQKTFYSTDSKSEPVEHELSTDP